jgi:hopanoid biosynthesis associated RND transporter like protein HpnN
MKPEDHSSHGGLLPHLLSGLVACVCRFPVLVLAVAAFLALASAGGAAAFLQYQTERTDLVNPHKDYQERWHKFVNEFGGEEDVVVLVKGADSNQMQMALDTLAARIAEHPDRFDRLFYKVDLRGLRNRALMFLPTETIEPIRENIRTMSLLLEFGPLSWQNLSLQSLVREAHLRADMLTAGQPLKPGDEQFFAQLKSISSAARASLANPADYRNPWGSLMAQPVGQDSKQLDEPQYFFSGDKTLAFLLVRPIKETGSFTGSRKSIDLLREIVASTGPEFAGLDIGLTGIPVLENDEMTAAQHDTTYASWLAIVGVTLLFFLVYRGVYYPLLTVGTLLVGTAWAMGWLTLTVGHLNILSATFAVMLFGMGDYGVLWVMRYEQARRSGMDVRSALLHTTTHVAVGNLTAAMTTALAFYAAMLADFKGVAELGWVAGSGVLLCAFACFTVLPALLILFDRREISTGEVIPIGTAAGWLPGLSRRPRGVALGGLALTACAVGFIFRLGYDHNLLHLQPRGLASVNWQMTLIEHTAGASWHALCSTATPQEALALKARFEKEPRVERVVEIASLVPPDQKQKVHLLADIQHRLRRLPVRGERIPHAAPNAHEMLGELNELIQQLGPLAARCPQPLLGELRQALTGLHDYLAATPLDEFTGARLAAFDEHLSRDLADDLLRLRDVSTPAPITLADLPPPLRERFVGKSGRWLVEVFAKENVRESLWDFGPLEAFCKDVRRVDPEATGQPFATVEGLKAMKNGFQWAGLYAFLAIVTVLLADFRSPWHVIIALTPLAMGLVLALGIMGLFGLPLNPANMIALPLILGVGVDNGVHLLHDYLIRRRDGLKTVSYPIGRGVLVKGMTTMIGFGTLMASSQRGLAGLGLVLTLGVGCCLLASLVFLPAALQVIGLGKRTSVPVVEPVRQSVAA